MNVLSAAQIIPRIQSVDSLVQRFWGNQPSLWFPTKPQIVFFFRITIKVKQTKHVFLETVFYIKTGCSSILVINLVIGTSHGSLTPKGGLRKGNPLISGKSRLVKYYEPFGQINGSERLLDLWSFIWLNIQRLFCLEMGPLIPILKISKNDGELSRCWTVNSAGVERWTQQVLNGELSRCI